MGSIIQWTTCELWWQMASIMKLLSMRSLCISNSVSLIGLWIFINFLYLRWTGHSWVLCAFQFDISSWEKMGNDTSSVNFKSLPIPEINRALKTLTVNWNYLPAAEIKLSFSQPLWILFNNLFLRNIQNSYNQYEFDSHSMNRSFIHFLLRAGNAL